MKTRETVKYTWPRGASPFLLALWLATTTTACPDTDEDSEVEVVDMGDDAASDAGDDAGVDVGDDAGGDLPIEPDADRDAVEDLAPDVEPDLSPDVDPDIAPDVEPDVEPDIAPDADGDAVEDLSDIDPDIAPDMEDATDADPDGVEDLPDPDMGDAVEDVPDVPPCPDADGDGVCDEDDVCAEGDDGADADDDGIADACDLCAEGDDAADVDSDGVPDACDACTGADDAADADGDGVPDGCDLCAEGDDVVDTDNDGVPDACDACAEGDDAADADGDGIADACDACADGDDGVDADSDGIADACDACTGADDAADADGDGVPDGCDLCAEGDDAADADNDGIADACDACPGADDGADGDGDGARCAADCDDADPRRAPGLMEVCDGADNNCDVAIDEGNPGGGVACETGSLGVCAAGTTACVEGALACAPNTAPAAEICDDLDNNCDGQTDEGNPGGGAACSTGLLGVCADGALVCEGGALSCAANAQPSAEICDGLDNNCDGEADEGNPGGGAACSTGLLGVCASGVLACQGGELTCDPDNAPSGEVCDNLDNDCDGTPDDGIVCVPPGGLDPGFGVGGVVTLALPNQPLDPRALGVTASGKVVVAGSNRPSGGNDDLWVARYLNNGAPDPTFGANGQATFDGDGGVDRGYALLIDQETAWVGGHVDRGDGPLFALWRLLPGGALDGAWGQGGLAVEADSVSATWYALARQDSGLPFAAGDARPDARRRLLGGAIDANGAHSPSAAPLPLANSGSLRGAARLGGDAILAGWIERGDDDDMIIARVNAAGVPVSGWGQGGVVQLDLTDMLALNSSDRAYAVVTDAQSRIWVAGRTGGADTRMVLVRLLADGTLDDSFGDGGVASLDFGPGHHGAFALALDGQGRALLVGTIEVNGDEAVGLVRLLPSGALDNTFGTLGRVTAQLDPSSPDLGVAIAIQPDGMILVLAQTRVNGRRAGALLRYWP
jgi:uncharacterized delta-60 repeat protein